MVKGEQETVVDSKRGLQSLTFYSSVASPVCNAPNNTGLVPRRIGQLMIIL